MSSCKIINEYKTEIEKYCIKNQLDSNKVFSFPKSWDRDTVFVLYHNEEKGRKELLGEISIAPATIVLKIEKKHNFLEFEQTAYTREYLSLR
jgi:hypothetical protein